LYKACLLVQCLLAARACRYSWAARGQGMQVLVPAAKLLISGALNRAHCRATPLVRSAVVLSYKERLHRLNLATQTVLKVR